MVSVLQHQKQRSTTTLGIILDIVLGEHQSVPPCSSCVLQTARDCWTVAFGNAYTDEDRCLAAGYDNGDVKLFDLRTQTMRWETNVKNGVTGLSFDRSDIEMNKVSYWGRVVVFY